jgi:predicted anti-sigma-YlaC factor YlaD
MSHPNEEALNDFVDGVLAEEYRDAVRRHLDDCAECRRTVDDLQTLVARARALGGIEPSRDLLAGIRPATRRKAGGSLGWTRWVAAAAVIALVGLLAVLRFDGSPGQPTSIESLLSDFKAAEAEYIRATEMLAAALEQRRDEIAPETLAVLDESLAEIDAAIMQARQARDREDAGVASSQLLTSLYQRKLNVLMSASRLSS